MQTTTKTARLTAGLVVAVLLAACTAADHETAAPPTQTPTASAPAPTATATAPSPSPSPTGDDLALDASCTMPTGDDVPDVTLHHPAGWEVSEGDITRCTFFAPDDPELEPNTEPEGVDVRWSVEPVPFSRVVQSDRATRDEHRVNAVVDGHRAVRTTATSTGKALLPEGVRITTWAVDLSRSAERAATLIGTAHDTGGVDYPRAVDVLDAMARRARIGG